MPGILPMKVIKVGTNAQTRIAQACDRCRSKKIRCDGIRPCCSQCANVGFECKTSDKLSRRAFPRGYTESLEERVRSLEAEVRELKDLLDEKDEKIDMLSRIHSQSSHPIQLPSPRRPSSTTVLGSPAAKSDSPSKDDVFKVQQSPYLLQEDGQESYFAGTSSGRTFIEAFKHRVQESGRSTAEMDTSQLLASSIRKSCEAGLTPPQSPTVFKAAPRLLSDQFVNIFFQEWAPLFPVLHRPTFLTLYERYVNDYDSVTDKAEIAQLNLVFGIAALSSGTRSSVDLDSFESQWRAAVDSILVDSSMSTLQALILAQLFCVQQGDLVRLQTYKGLSTSLSARLGLHQSQKRFALGTLTCETRKKVFWTLYTVDAFTAVMLGLPKHLKDGDVHCEIPCDADDEYVTERGFQATLPGESTKLSSALALFRAARILSKVLEEVYPAQTSYELSLQKLGELSDELDVWSNSLPPHLRLQFAQDKPSTGTISSRSPLLSLTYHYIRALIHRPAVCASIGARSSTSMISMAGSCKHVIQIVQLLTERGLSFSFCLNKDELLVLSGFGLLYQGFGLDTNSKILKDDSKMIAAVIEALTKSAAPCTLAFERVATSFVKVPLQPAPPPPRAKAKIPSLSRHNSDTGPSTQTHGPPLSTRKHLKAIASRLALSASRGQKQGFTEPRKSTVRHISLQPYNLVPQSQPSLQPSASYDRASTSRSEPARSPGDMYSRATSTKTIPTNTNTNTNTGTGTGTGTGHFASRPPVSPPQSKPKPEQHPAPLKLPNLDYLSFGLEPDVLTSSSPSRPTEAIKSEPSPTDWQKLLGDLDNGATNIYDACYGGPPIDALRDAQPALTSLCSSNSRDNSASNSAASVAHDSTAWNADLCAICQVDTGTSSSCCSGGEDCGGARAAAALANSAGSILSFSTDDGALGSSSGDDVDFDFDFAKDWTSAASSSNASNHHPGDQNGSVKDGPDEPFHRDTVLPFPEHPHHHHHHLLGFGDGDDGGWEAELNL